MPALAAISATRCEIALGLKRVLVITTAGLLAVTSLDVLTAPKPARKPPHVNSGAWVPNAITSVPPLEWHGAAAEALRKFGTIGRTLEAPSGGAMVPRWTDYVVALNAPGSRFSLTDPPSGRVNAIIADGLRNTWSVVVDDSAHPSESVHFVVIGRVGEPLWFAMEPIAPRGSQAAIANVTTNICRIFTAADAVFLTNFPDGAVDYLPLACTSH